MEEWKNVFDGYDVSSYGRFRSNDRVIIKTRKKKGGVSAPFTVNKKGVIFSDKRLNTDGYVHVDVHGGNKLLHRLVAIAFIPNPLNLPVINHKNGCKTDNNVDNLEWCTPKYNIEHAVINNLKTNPAKGERVVLAKFTDEEMEILKPRIMASDLSHAHWGRTLNVHGNTIAAIRHGDTWKHIK